MQATPTIENVTLSLPNDDIAVLCLLSKRMGWKVKMHRKSGLEKALEDVAAGRVYEAVSFEELIDQLEASSTTPPHANIRRKKSCNVFCKPQPMLMRAET